MQKSSFFNAKIEDGQPDRVYLAEDFAEYFNSFISNGVFVNPSTSLQVMANDNMTITVETGKAWINGYFYQNTKPYILDIDPADGKLDRIDLIYLALDLEKREVRLGLTKGVPSPQAEKPSLIRRKDLYQLGIAYIYLDRGATKITQANISDLRLNNEYCGPVHGVVDQVDTTTIFNQYAKWFEETTNEANTDIEKIKAQFEKDISVYKNEYIEWLEQFTTSSEEEFNTWFDGIKDILDESAATKLYEYIKAVEEELNTKANESDLEGLATEKYVNDQISQIPEVDLTPINDDIDNLKESKANLIIKGIDPTIEDKDYPIGQMWFNKENGSLFILKNVDEGKAYWAVNDEHREIAPVFGPYGFKVDENNTNPETAVTYTENAVGKTPAKASDLGSWEDEIKKLATPMLLKNGQVQYELQHDDFTKKKNGGPSNLTGDDGDVMIRIPHIYVKENHSGNIKNVILTDKPTDGFISYTKQTEKGYNQLSWGLLMTMQHLYLLFYKDRDSQTALGRGSVDWTSSDEFLKTGGTNTKPFCFGETSGKQQMKFLGIEDFWGNKTQWVDGLVSDSSYNGKVGYSNFNDNGSGYKTISTSNSSSLSGYFKNTQGNELGYLLKDNGTASSSTGYADYGYLYSGSVAYFGGNRSYGSAAGAFHVRVYYSASDALSYRSARLCFVDENYFYIGAYLGSDIGGKLRSVSGQMPLGNKTIGQCRTLAQANN